MSTRSCFGRFTPVLTLLLIAGLQFGCSAAERQSSMTSDSKKLTQATEKGDFEKTMSEAQAAWENRVERKSLEKSINLWQKAAKMDTPNLSEAERAETLATIYETLARAYYFLADSHVRMEGDEDEMAEQMMATFEKGVTAAEKAIALRDPKFAAAVAADPANWQTAVKSADPKAIPGLYWYSTNLGKWALLEGIATILSRKDDIKGTLDWIMKNDPNYFYGAPYRYFGSYHTKVPLGGGDPPKSRAAFEKSLEIAPNYLATRVLMAENYAVLVGDRDLFEKLLNETLKTPASAAPEVEAENIFEQRKAKRLLENADNYFY